MVKSIRKIWLLVCILFCTLCAVLGVHISTLSASAANASITLTGYRYATYSGDNLVVCLTPSSEANWRENAGEIGVYLNGKKTVATAVYSGNDFKDWQFNIPLPEGDTKAAGTTYYLTVPEGQTFNNGDTMSADASFSLIYNGSAFTGYVAVENSMSSMNWAGHNVANGILYNQFVPSVSYTGYPASVTVPVTVNGVATTSAINNDGGKWQFAINVPNFETVKGNAYHVVIPAGTVFPDGTVLGVEEHWLSVCTDTAGTYTKIKLTSSDIQLKPNYFVDGSKASLTLVCDTSVANVWDSTSFNFVGTIKKAGGTVQNVAGTIANGSSTASGATITFTGYASDHTTDTLYVTIPAGTAFKNGYYLAEDCCFKLNPGSDRYSGTVVAAPEIGFTWYGTAVTSVSAFAGESASSLKATPAGATITWSNGAVVDGKLAVGTHTATATYIDDFDRTVTKSITVSATERAEAELTSISFTRTRTDAANSIKYLEIVFNSTDTGSGEKNVTVLVNGEEATATLTSDTSTTTFTISDPKGWSQSTAASFYVTIPAGTVFGNGSELTEACSWTIVQGAAMGASGNWIIGACTGESAANAGTTSLNSISYTRTIIPGKNRLDIQFAIDKTIAGSQTITSEVLVNGAPAKAEFTVSGTTATFYVIDPKGWSQSAGTGFYVTMPEHIVFHDGSRMAAKTSWVIVQGSAMAQSGNYVQASATGIPATSATATTLNGVSFTRTRTNPDKTTKYLEIQITANRTLTGNAVNTYVEVNGSEELANLSVSGTTATFTLTNPTFWTDENASKNGSVFNVRIPAHTVFGDKGITTEDTHYIITQKSDLALNAAGTWYMSTCEGVKKVAPTISFTWNGAAATTVNATEGNSASLLVANVTATGVTGATTGITWSDGAVVDGKLTIGTHTATATYTDAYEQTATKTITVNVAKKVIVYNSMSSMSWAGHNVANGILYNQFVPSVSYTGYPASVTVPVTVNGVATTSAINNDGGKWQFAISVPGIVAANGNAYHVVIPAGTEFPDGTVLAEEEHWLSVCNNASGNGYVKVRLTAVETQMHPTYVVDGSKTKLQMVFTNPILPSVHNNQTINVTATINNAAVNGIISDNGDKSGVTFIFDGYASDHTEDTLLVTIPAGTAFYNGTYFEKEVSYLLVGKAGADRYTVAKHEITFTWDGVDTERVETIAGDDATLLAANVNGVAASITWSDGAHDANNKLLEGIHTATATYTDDKGTITDTITVEVVFGSTVFQMAEGASVRADGNGLRFQATIDEDGYNTFTNQGGVFGMIIVPKDYITEGYELTVENLFGANAKYSTTAKAGVDQAVRLMTKLEGLTPKLDENGMYSYYGGIHDLITSNITREFVGVGYVKAGEKYALASFAHNDIDHNSRSMYYVSQRVIDEKHELSSAVQTNYIDKYTKLLTDNGKTYTVTYTIKVYYQNHGELTVTETTKTATLNQMITEIADAPNEGFILNSDSSITAKMYANKENVFEFFYKNEAFTGIDVSAWVMNPLNGADDVKIASVADDLKDAGITTVYLIWTGAYANDTAGVAKLKTFINGLYAKGISSIVCTHNSGASMSESYTELPDFSDCAGFKGFLAWDEPTIDMMTTMADYATMFETTYTDAGKNGTFMVNLLPSYATEDKVGSDYKAYIKAYCDAVWTENFDGKKWLSLDTYPILSDGKLESSFAYDLAMLKAFAVEYGAEAHVALQASGWDEGSDTKAKAPTEAQMSFQAYTALAMGVDSYSWFSYGPVNETVLAGQSPVNLNGTKNETIYNALKNVNKEIATFGDVYKTYEWQGSIINQGSYTTNLFSGAAAKAAKAEKEALGTAKNDGKFAPYALDASNTDFSEISSSNNFVMGVMANGEGKQAYVVSNYSSVKANKTATITLKTTEAKTFNVYKDGSVEKVTIDGSYTLTLAVGEGAFIQAL